MLTQLVDFKLFIYLFLGLIISDQFCLWVFKKNIRRFRPKTWLEWGKDEVIKQTHRNYFADYTGYSAQSLSSMCSSHAANYLAQAILLSYFIPTFALLFYSIAVLVSIGRFYIGAHWMSDILVGWLVGFASAALCITFIIPWLGQWL